jgi:hypothetical protein
MFVVWQKGVVLHDCEGKIFSLYNKTRMKQSCLFHWTEDILPVTLNEKEFRLLDFSSWWQIFSSLDFSFLLTILLCRFAFTVDSWKFFPTPSESWLWDWTSHESCFLRNSQIVVDAPPLEKTFQGKGGLDMADCFLQAEEQLLGRFISPPPNTVGRRGQF